MDAKKIGSCIRMAMAKDGRGSTWLGKKMGVTRQTIHAWRGGGCTDIIRLGEIATALGTTYEEMMQLAD